MHVYGRNHRATMRLSSPFRISMHADTLDRLLWLVTHTRTVDPKRRSSRALCPRVLRCQTEKTLIRRGLRYPDDC